MLHKLSLSILTIAMVLPVNAQLGKVLEGLGNRGGPSDSKTASGLKEALQIGTDHAVDLTGTTDGFFKNEAIKILLPDRLKTAEKGLRLSGMGGKIDEFELSMNRAAEKAAPAARGIFKDALLPMTFDDVHKILTGGNTSATEYFKAKTSEKLTASFKPTVESAMEETGVVRRISKSPEVCSHFRSGAAKVSTLPITWLGRPSTDFSICSAKRKRRFARIPPRRSLHC